MPGRRTAAGGHRRPSIHAGLAAGLLALSACGTLPGRVPAIVDAPAASRVSATVAGGVVSGARSPDGTVFLGIPFAAPPVGARRFAPPAPVEPWDGVRDATAVGALCPQSALVPGRKSEDCLTLNVYAPPHAGEDAGKLPVMVWLHGGALALGGGAQYDPSLFAARQGVVVVTANYRLGALGFLAHPALGGTGEGAYGLMDQQAALAWVRDNIAAFGGDASSVTLFGESAGALSTCAHLAAPASRGLFHRAIIQSGGCAEPDMTLPRAEAESGGMATAADLGCAGAPDVAACLRAVPVERLRRAESHRRGNGGADGWSPMTGGDVLPRPPLEVFRRGGAAPVPVVMGSNENEGRLFTNLLGGLLATPAGYRYGLELILREDLVTPTLARYDDLARHSRPEAFASILTDSRFACPVLEMHRLLGSRAPFYAYEFRDPHAPSNLPPLPFRPPQGAFHASEIVYLFQRPWALADPAAFDGRQSDLPRRMQDHWGRFARTGDPGGGWKPLRADAPFELSTGAPALARDFPQRHRCDFWRAQLYPATPR